MKGTIVIGGIAALVLILGVAGGYAAGALLAPPDKSKTASKATKAPEPVAAPAPTGITPPDPSLFYDLPEMLVTVKDPVNGIRVLQLTVSIECQGQGDIDKLKAYLPRVLDVFQTYVSGLTMKDIRGTKNIEALRIHLRDQVSEAIAPGKVKTILFHGLSVQ